jgi:glycosyltransferase involved in cell wall biosynthesis
LSEPAGDSVAIIEACTVDVGWVGLTEIPLRGVAPSPAAPALPAPVFHPHEFARALRLVLTHGLERPFADVATKLVAALPLPSVVRYAPLPFHGHLHQPSLLERANFGRLIVEGWLFHETSPIRRVAASVDLQAWSELEYGAALPYVADLFPQHIGARASRLSGFIDVPSNLPPPLTVRLYAELADGTWHLCHVQRNLVVDGETAKLPVGRFGLGRFVAAVRALREAALAHGLSVPLDAGFWRAVREVFRDYRARADRGAFCDAPTPTLDLSASPPARVTLISHNLNLEGAPLFLLEFARHLAAGGSRLTVLSAAEGKLRAAFESLGAEVRVLELRPLQAANDLTHWRAALGGLDAAAGLAGADLVIANTISAHWGVHLAHRAGRPSLFYIHESTSPDAFYHGHLAPALLPVVKESFALATHVSFLTDTTRRYYRPVLTRPNHSLNPGWIDVARLREFLAAHPRPALRTALGLADDVRLVINVGSVCDRKGQHLFARAVDLLWRMDPQLAARAEFLMVGGRDTPFDRVVADLVLQLYRPNLRVVGEVSEPQRYYGAADLFVCSSFEESFPRVVLEAMVAGVPIVSTDVHGVPEMARADREALLVPPGNPAALAGAMLTLLRDAPRARRLADAAAARVAAEFDSARLLPRHAALAAAVSARH